MDRDSDNKNLGLIYENGLNMWAIADSQQNQPHNNLPISDIKNSYANVSNTNQLPGNSAKTNIANQPSFGENEEVMVKGYGKMTKSQLKRLIDKTIDAIYDMKKLGKYNQIHNKLDLLKLLLKHYKQ